MPPIPSVASPAQVAWGKAHQYCDKLFDALVELHVAGGSSQASMVGGWGKKAQEKALATMTATHAALGEEIARLKVSMRPSAGRRGRLG